jgi:hypothetical protein
LVAAGTGDSRGGRGRGGGCRRYCRCTRHRSGRGRRREGLVSTLGGGALQQGGRPGLRCRIDPVDLRARLDAIALAGLEGIDDRLKALDRQVFISVIADHHHRRVDAGAKALDFFPAQRSRRVGMERIVVDAMLADGPQVLGAAQHAGRGAADEDVGLAADGLQQELRIERRDFKDADVGHAQHLGDCLDGRTRDPALLLLGPPKQRDHRRLLAPGGIFGDLGGGPAGIVGREGKACRLDGRIG